MTGDASKTDVAELITLARQDHPVARDQLLGRYRNYLRLLAWQRLPRSLSRRADGSDVVQETLMDAARGLREFRGETECEFTAWLLRLLDRNLLQTARMNTAEKRDLRREAFDARGNSSAHLLWRSICDNGQSAETVALSVEASLQLAQALERLPDDQRTAIELRYLRQEPLQAIAREMERSVSSVAGLIRRGVAALRTHLPPELGEEDLNG